MVKKLLHTVAAIVVLAAVSLSWIVAVEFIPESERPYIGGSNSNSAIELALGYNGAARLLGNQVAGSTHGPNHPHDSDIHPENIIQTDAFSESIQPENLEFGPYTVYANKPGGGVGGAEENGEIGVSRLFSQQLSGLISWFLLPAIGIVVIVGVGIVWWLIKHKSPDCSEEQLIKLKQIIFWGAWLLPMTVFFSVAGFMHRYYVIILSPAIGALTAAAAVSAWKNKRRRWLIPFIFSVTLGVQCLIVGSSLWTWLLIPMLVAGTVSMLLFQIGKTALHTTVAVLISISLFAAPLAWSLTPVIGSLNAHIPDARPEADKNIRNAPQEEKVEELLDFVVGNYNCERWALAVPNANMAAPIILKTGLPVMAVGGFSGNDSILTVEKLHEYVFNGELRYYMITENSLDQAIIRWVSEHGAPVSQIGASLLYDLKEAVQ